MLYAIILYKATYSKAFFFFLPDLFFDIKIYGAFRYDTIPVLDLQTHQTQGVLYRMQIEPRVFYHCTVYTHTASALWHQYQRRRVVFISNWALGEFHISYGALLSTSAVLCIILIFTALCIGLYLYCAVLPYPRAVHPQFRNSNRNTDTCATARYRKVLYSTTRVDWGTLPRIYIYHTCTALHLPLLPIFILVTVPLVLI